jgi:hypothetical protein
MKDRRIKPTDGLECTTACPSFKNGLCMVCGCVAKFTVESPSPLGTVQGCTPAQDAIRDTYRASRKKAPRQEYTVVSDPRIADLVMQVQDKLDGGYSLVGGMIYGEDRFHQAMVRDAPAVPGPEDMPEGFYVPDRRPTDPQ